MTTNAMTATISMIRYGEAFVESFSSTGEWLGGGLVRVRSGRREDLFTAGRDKASQNARAHGGVLTSFEWVASKLPAGWA